MFWLCASKSVVIYKRKKGIKNRYLVDLSDSKCTEKNYDKNYLAELERAADCKINDIIHKDRMLVKLDYDEALGYIYGLCTKIEESLIKSRVEMVVGLADTALQLITIAICRKLNIKWRLFVSMRIPRGVYGYSKSELSCDLCEINPIGDESLAKKIIEEFTNKEVLPVSWSSSLNLRAISRKMPIHIKLLIRKIRESMDDSGNVYSRYSPFELVKRYVERKINGYKYLNKIKLVKNLEDKYYFYALQTQPESSIDVMGAPYSNQIELISLIARSIDISKFLYVKAHPGDIDGKKLSFYTAIEKIPGVKLVHHGISSRELIENAECIFTVSGTVGYEGAILGRPVVAFARNYYNIFPTVKYCSDLTDISSRIKQAILESKSNNSNEILNSMTELTRKFCFKAEFVPALDPITGADGLPSARDMSIMVDSIKILLKESA